MSIREIDSEDIDQQIDNSIEGSEATARESMFSTAEETNNNDQVYSDLDYRQKLWTPDAKQLYPEINRDVTGANMGVDEIVWARLRHKYLNHINYLTQKGFDLKNLKKLVEANIAFTFNSSLSIEGFLRKNMHTQRMKFGKEIEERTQHKSAMPIGFKK